MNSKFKDLTKDEKLKVNGGGIFGIILCGTIGAEVGMVIALAYNVVTGAHGDEARENTATLCKTGAIVGGCIGAYVVI